jgi:RNA polymerase sigma-54 factor
VMTTQMQQSIQLLQMNSLELEQHINQELMENPFLEASEGGEEEDQLLSNSSDDSDVAREGNDLDSAEDGLGASSEQSLSAEIEAEAPSAAAELDSRFDQDEPLLSANGSDLLKGVESPDDRAASPGSEEPAPTAEAKVDLDLDQLFDDSEPRSLASTYEADSEEHDFTTYTAAKVTAYEDLSWQLSMSNLEGREREVGEHILGLLDEDGYLRVPIEDIAEEFNMEACDVEDILAVIQTFEPAGIGARDLVECLTLQMESLGQKDREYYKVVVRHFDLLQAKKFKEIQKETGLSEEKVSQIFHYVSKLNPRPGRKLIPHEARYIKPDVFVKEIDGEYLYYLNEGRSGRLRINHYYRDLIGSRGKLAFTPQEKEFTVNKYKNAVWLIKNIEKRKETILRVTEAIMQYQREFLEKGIDHLKPLTLKTIASIVGMHESTIARVTTGKYVETPRGTFELKFFFSSALETDSGEDASSRSIKEKIKHIISEETPKKPYSDQKIANMLQGQGVKIARRTVAKYREQMKILPAKLRKAV